MGRIAVAVAVLLVAALALAACGSSTSDGSSSATPSATPSTSESPSPPVMTAGAAVFADNCATCHGADGSGDSGPDIRAEDNRAEITLVVRNGKEEMPAFKGQLTAAQIAAVSKYVAGGLK